VGTGLAENAVVVVGEHVEEGVERLTTHILLRETT
jgi:hypothetical protein